MITRRTITAALICATLATTALLQILFSSSASAAGINPAANIKPVPSYGATCQAAPRGVACQSAAIAALNHARAVMGKRAYSLPAGFQNSSTEAQLLALTNDDRALYGRTAVRGLNSTLTAAAKAALVRDADPVGPNRVDGVAFRAWTSNWAAGYASPLYTYYVWMYQDGPGLNLDCPKAGAAGCWGHRNNTLFDFGSGNQVAMGVATGTSPDYKAPAFTTLYEAFPANARISYLPVVKSVLASGSSAVTIRGAGFVGVRSVTIGSRSVPFTVTSSSAMVAVLSTGTGPVTVTVTAAGGTSAALTFAGLPKQAPVSTAPRAAVAIATVHPLRARHAAAAVGAA